MPAPQLLVAFATNCMVALLNAYGVRRFVGDPPWFGTLHKASLYIVITAGVSPALSALGGAFVPILGGGEVSNYWIYWAHWYVANALPNLTIGPVFLIWFANGTSWSRWIPSRRHIEPVILTALLLGACIVATQVGGLVTSAFLPVLLFLPLPLVLWAAVRYGEKGASGAILVVTVVLTWRTLHGSGLLLDADPERSVLALQLFLTGLAIPVLLLGALIDELRGAEQTMRELATSLVRAQDEERRRIARDLHDSTGQNLIAATLLLGRIEAALPASAKPILQQLEEVLQQSIREVRTVSYLLHPPLLDEAGLGPALRCYVDGYIERSGLAVDLEVAPERTAAARCRTGVVPSRARGADERLPSLPKPDRTNSARARESKRWTERRADRRRRGPGNAGNKQRTCADRSKHRVEERRRRVGQHARAPASNRRAAGNRFRCGTDNRKSDYPGAR